MPEASDSGNDPGNHGIILQLSAALSGIKYFSLVTRVAPPLIQSSSFEDTASSGCMQVFSGPVLMGQPASYAQAGRGARLHV